MKYCPYCGKLLLGDDSACPKCKKKIATHAYEGYYTVAEPNEFYHLMSKKANVQSALSMIFSIVSTFFALKWLANPFKSCCAFVSLAFLVVSLILRRKFLKAGYHKNTFIFLSRAFSIYSLILNIITCVVGFLALLVALIALVSLLIILL